MELRFRYAFVSFLYRILNSDTLLLRPVRFYCALAVSATIRVILTKISNRSGIAVQWNGGGEFKQQTEQYAPGKPETICLNAPLDYPAQFKTLNKYLRVVE